MRSAVRHYWRTSGTWERVWMLFLVATAFLILAGAPLPPLDAGDKFYGDIARHIVASGDWLTLKHPNQPGWVVDKPPLSFWLMALSILLAGDNEIALRLGQLLMAVVAIGVTFRIARLGAGREEALLAALLLGTSAGFFYVSLSQKQDVPLNLFLALAFYEYLIHRSEGSTRSAVLSGVWVALAVLSKGVVALAVFILVVGVDCLGSSPSRGAGRGRWAAQVAAGVAAFVLVGAPWFIVGAIRQGRPFIDTFFLGGALGVGRFFRAVVQPLPYWEAVLVAIPIILIGMLPWTGFLPGAIREAWRSVRTGPPSVRLSALWAGLYFSLVALSPGDKMFHYLLPVQPPMMVLVARAVNAAATDARRLPMPAAVALPMAAWVALTQVRYPQLMRFFSLPLAGILLAVLGVCAFFALRGRRRVAVAVACAAILLAYGLFEWTLLKHLGPGRFVTELFVEVSS